MTPTPATPGCPTPGARSCFGYMTPDEIAAAEAAFSVADDKATMLRELLRQHRCKSDGAMTVAECIDTGRCGCADGLACKAA